MNAALVYLMFIVDMPGSKKELINKVYQNLGFSKNFSSIIINDFFDYISSQLIKTKKVKISKEEAAEFYKVHQTKPFYDKLCTYLSSGPIIVMVLEGENVILKNRELMGATDPTKAQDGTLRKMYGLSIDKNSVHGSDSVENGKIEIDFFFK